MKFWEAMRLFQYGKKVRCKQWSLRHHLDPQKRNLLVKLEGLYFDSSFLDEWELYEEPVQLLSFMEVIQGLREGKKFRRKCCPLSPAIYLLENRDIYTAGETWDGCSIEDFEATDWIEVKE